MASGEVVSRLGMVGIIPDAESARRAGQVYAA
jgi:hypothetical protein